jgi:MscS family membrane protein
MQNPARTRLQPAKGKETATVVPKLFSKVRRQMLILLLGCLAGAIFISAQTSALAQTQKPPATQPAPPTESLGRDTPRGTLIGFIQAAQDEREAAVDYFQPQGKVHRSTPEEERELAGQLLAVLNARFPTSALDSLSRDPLAHGDDGQPQNQIRIGGTRSLSETFPIVLVRLDLQGNKLWFISRQTLDQVPAVYDSLRFPRIEKELPGFLVKSRPLGMPLWQWIAIILLAPIALALGWVLASLARICSEFMLRQRGRPPLADEPRRRFGPGALLVAVLIHYYFVYFIGASLLYRQYYRQVIWVFLAFAFYWAVTRVTHRISRDISQRLTDRGRLAERSLVSLTRRVLDVLIFIIVGLELLKSVFEVNVTAALAGLGIGGLAIGLGAQKTFENLLGGISILTDKAIVVGDPCRIGDQRGVVEDIGLRSTKLRTEDRTVVSIPNGTVATATLENFRLRDKILCRQVVRLRYDLSPDHVRYVLTEVHEVLVRHAKVEEGTARVRLLRFGENAIEVEIYAYILERDYSEFLATQEDLLLQVMETLERTGGAVALPSQTTMVTQDKWVDPEKAAAAQKAVEKNRAPGPQRP